MKPILKTILIIGIIFSWPSFVLADSADSHKSGIEEGQKLVEEKINCDDLNDEQLEAVGEYLMEQMHPGESHEIMDQMMGGEDSDSLKQMHIQMAKRIYCNEDIGGMMGGGMMNMMMGNNMMGSGMMSGANNSGTGNMMNMMGWGSGMGWSWFGWIFMILFWVLLIVGIIALIKWLINQIAGEKKTKSVLDILKERYAGGEISKQEFEEKKKDLT